MTLTLVVVGLVLAPPTGWLLGAVVFYRLRRNRGGFGGLSCRRGMKDPVLTDPP